MSHESRTEEELRRSVRAQTEQAHAEDVTLLGELLLGAHSQLGRLDGHPIESDGRRLQLMLLTQSINAGFCAFNLLTEGYPRMALVFARFLREGHIALRWSSSPEAEAEVERHFGNFRAGRDAPRGSWPAVGKMAKHLPESFRESSAYQALHESTRTMHNALFSHAVSDWALGAAFGQTKDTSWHPAVGPTYQPGTVRNAVDGLGPFVGWLLIDAAEFVAAAGLEPDHANVDPLVDRFKRRFART